MKQILKIVRDASGRIRGAPKERGMILAEVLVALAIMGTVVIISLSSLSTGSKAVGVVYEGSMAENIARSQLENTKSQSYKIAPATYDSIDSLPYGFTVSSEASTIDGSDENIQKITVTVYRNGEPVLVREGYKMNR